MSRQLATAAEIACRHVGTTLFGEPGWDNRGHGTTPVHWRAVMWHNTVSPATWSRQQLDRLLRDGHGNLPGPIANVSLHRTGDATLIAAGRAYHAGPGRDPIGARIQAGNLHTVGIEAANDGREDWTDAQYRWAVAFTAALGLRPLGHFEWAPYRKQDPDQLDMHRARADVAAWRQEDPMATLDTDDIDAIAHAVTRAVWEHPVGRTGETHTYQLSKARGDAAAARALVEGLASDAGIDQDRLAEQVAARVDIDIDELAARIGHRATAVEVADELARRLTDSGGASA